MFRKNKKGVAIILIGVVFFIVALAIVVLPRINSPAVFSEFIGEQQYDVLISSKQAEAAQNYILDSFEFAANNAVSSLITHAGFYVEGSAVSTAVPYPCGTHIYPTISFFKPSCVPDYLINYKAYVFDDFHQYEKAYTRDTIQVPYDFSAIPDDSTVHLLGQSSRALQLPIGSQETMLSTAKDNAYARTTLGGYGDEKITLCTTGQCVADIATSFYEKFTVSGTSLPYVLGGESPYTYEDTKVLTTLPDSFFSGVSVTEYLPDKKPLKTEPGFDSAGWVWWVGKHAGVQEFTIRKIEKVYLENAQKSTTATLICGGSNPCYTTTISAQAQPGDILYYGTSLEATHMMIYVGDGMIIHSRPTAGLIKEKIPLYYATDKETKIIAAYRYNYASDDTSESATTVEEKSLPVSTSLIGPGVWCTGQEQSVSKTYANRILNEAFGVSGTLRDIAIQAGLEQNIDPALIATHMQWESGMGENNNCISVGKSHLTGCGWPPSCSSNCLCENGHVLNDLTQVQCTATTDLHAFTEAMTGKNVAVGKYSECNAYSDDPATMWTCMLCIYQGNYAKDVTSKGNPYFTKDGTCHYAENFQTSYCSWRRYFANEGYELSDTYFATPSNSRTSNYVSFSPIVDAQASISFTELEHITNFAQEMTTECVDALASCVDTKLSREYDIPISRNTEDNALALDIIDQLQDCRTNGQTDCVCAVHINFTLPSAGFDKYAIKITDTGEVFAAERFFEGLDSESRVQLYDFNKAFTQVLLEKQEHHDYVELFIDKTNPSLSTFEAQDGLIFGGDYTFKLNETLYLFKQGNESDNTDSYLWLPREYFSGDAYYSCKENKNTFRFTTDLSFSEEPLLFSLELNDSTPPKISSLQVGEAICLSHQSLALQWNVPKGSDPVHHFTVRLNNDENLFYFFEQEAQPYDPELKALHAFTLYKDDNPALNSVVYRLVLLKTPDGSDFLTGLAQGVQITAEDHYNNSVVINKQYQFNTLSTGELPEYSREGSIFSGVFDKTLSCTTSWYYLEQDDGTLKKTGESFSFVPPSFTTLIVDFKEEETKTVSTDHILTDFAPSVYMQSDGSVLKDELFGKPVYEIKNISHVVCDETATSYKKICGASKDLVSQLAVLSEEYLQPSGYTLQVNQAYRTYDIQKHFWDLYVAGKGSPACNPNPKGVKQCRHSISGAIDVAIFDEHGKKVSDAMREQIMCQYDFVRFSGEQWHYEFGTSRWDAGMKEKANGGDGCAI